MIITNSEDTKCLIAFSSSLTIWHPYYLDGLLNKTFVA